MERLPMTERGGPPFTEEETAAIRALARRLKEMITSHLQAPVPNRQEVLKFCEVVERLRELANGNPAPLREYLGMH